MLLVLLLLMSVQTVVFLFLYYFLKFVLFVASFLVFNEENVCYFYIEFCALCVLAFRILVEKWLF